jgi:hypothetical protein
MHRERTHQLTSGANPSCSKNAWVWLSSAPPPRPPGATSAQRAQDVALAVAMALRNEPTTTDAMDDAYTAYAESLPPIVFAVDPRIHAQRVHHAIARVAELSAEARAPATFHERYVLPSCSTIRSTL